MTSTTASADETVAVTGPSDSGTNAYEILGARQYGGIHGVTVSLPEVILSTFTLKKMKSPKLSSPDWQTVLGAVCVTASLPEVILF